LIPGHYNTAQLSAPGDDAYGLDLKFLAGRTFGRTRFEGVLGYAMNEGSVPESWSLGLKAIQQVASNVWLEAGYHYFDADGSLDIGGPGFTPGRLPEVSEKGQVLEGAVAFTDSGKRYYRVYYSQLFEGRNVGREKTIGASISFRF